MNGHIINVETMQLSFQFNKEIETGSFFIVFVHRFYK